MEELCDLSNKLFYNFIFNKKKNIIFEDVNYVENIIRPKMDKSFEKYLYPKIDIDRYMYLYKKSKIVRKKCVLKTTKILLKKDIESVYAYVQNERDKTKVEEKLDEIIYKKLPSTISNIDNYLNDISADTTKTNILILGAGPNGLFIANYLNFIYKNRINILVIDNRLYKEKYREPYTRERPFAIGFPTYFSMVIPKLTCYSGEDSLLFKIKYLEMLLYLEAFNKNIPIYFTKRYETFKEAKELINIGNFKVCFDSTGGRIKTNFDLKNFKIPKSYITKKHDYKMVRSGNYLKLEWLKKPEKNKYYSFIYLYDKNYKIMDQKVHNSEFISILDIDDVRDYETLKDVCVETDYLENVINDVQNTNLKKILIHDLKIIREIPEIKYIYINSIQIQIYHALKIAFLLNIADEKRCIWIGSGDTIFHSHYIKGAGLNRTIRISTNIMHLLEMIM